MKRLMLSIAFLLMYAVVAEACETWSELRDGKAVLCQRCGNVVFCA